MVVAGEGRVVDPTRDVAVSIDPSALEQAASRMLTPATRAKTFFTLELASVCCIL